jgi:glycosyltransferase involved in cell wall biosynthesis
MTLGSVSVIIPTFNHGSLLGRAIASIRNQRWPGVDLVVVDDGSTDETPRLLRDMAGPDLCVLGQSNSGPAAARNRGVRHASGDWIGFLDADDIWLPGKLGSQANLVFDQPRISVTWGWTRFRFPDGAEYDWLPRFAQAPVLELLFGPRFHLSTVLVRRSCFLESSGFDETYRTGEDWDLWLRLLSRFEGAETSELLAVSDRRADDRSRYPTRDVVASTTRLLAKALANEELQMRVAGLRTPEGRRVLLAWHQMVFAKSFASDGHWLRALARAARSVWNDPRGLAYALSGMKGRARAINRLACMTAHSTG